MQKIEVAAKTVAVLLGGKCLVDDSVFQALSTVDRGDAVKKFVDSGGGIEFTPNFRAFTDYKNIADGLRLGNDVSDALAFNGITLPPEYRDVIRQYTAVIAPILTTLASLRPAWNYADRPGKIADPLVFGKDLISRGSFHIHLRLAKRIWDLWAKAIARTEFGKAKKHTNFSGGNSKKPRFTTDGNSRLKENNMVKVVYVDKDVLRFDDKSELSSDHDQDCCEHHYLDFSQYSLSDFDGLEFDLSADAFFERVDDYGIRLLPVNGHPLSVPGYGHNSGYYSANLTLVLERPGASTKFDITECQKISD